MYIVSNWLLSFGKDVWILWCTKSTIISNKIKEVKNSEEIKNPAYTCTDRFSFGLSHDTVTSSCSFFDPHQRIPTVTNLRDIPHIFMYDAAHSIKATSPCVIEFRWICCSYVPRFVRLRNKKSSVSQKNIVHFHSDACIGTR